MISTVTVSTITTITTIAAMGLAVGAGIAGVLIAFLVTKTLTGASQCAPAQLTARFLNVSVVPMMLVFVVTVAVEITRMLC